MPPTIWPPQGQPSFEFKMPCCACSASCKSVTGVNLSTNCDVDWTVYPPGTLAYPPSTYVYNYAFPSSPPFDITFTFTGANNCDGTWTFTLSGLDVTSTDPGVSGIGGIVMAAGGAFTSVTKNGDTVTSLPGCGILPAGASGITVQWYYSYGGHLNPASSGDTGAALHFAPASANNVPNLIEYFINDPSSPYPFDAAADCTSGYVKQGYCPDVYSFHYFANIFTATGLTAGLQYCLQIPYQWQPLSGGAWSALTTICVQFTATSATESTGWIDVGAATVLLAASGGANYRLDPAGQTCVLDPTGSICGSC